MDDCGQVLKPFAKPPFRLSRSFSEATCLEGHLQRVALKSPREGVALPRLPVKKFLVLH